MVIGGMILSTALVTLVPKTRTMCMMDSGNMELRKDKDNLLLKNKSTQVDGTKINIIDLEYYSVKMDLCMKGTGLKEKDKAWGNLSFQTEISILENFKMRSSMEKYETF